MSTVPPTFDPLWHRVVDLRICLRMGVEIFPQRFRGRKWYVIRDSLSGKFFRIRPEAYQFVCELERRSTVGEAWEKRLEIDPDNAPGQGEVVYLLSSLHRSGLLEANEEGDVDPLAHAFSEEMFKEVKQRWSSILFFKLPLFNPNSLLKRTYPYFAFLFTKIGMLLWLILLGFACLAIANNWKEFWNESLGVLGTANLPWLFVVMVVVKVLHEFGHGYVCRKYGGEVPETGVMLLLFSPLPYVDASSSSAFRDKWQRIAVGVAGVIVELTIASLAVLLWANTGDGILHRLAHNTVLVASVSTLFFNLNPLLRFDGYHIFSDWLELPNLQANAKRMTLHLLERYFFGLRSSRSPVTTKREGAWLVVYFFASNIYRIFILCGILLVVSLNYLIFGILLAVVFGAIWLVKPIVKSITYLLYSPTLVEVRGRAVSLVLLLVLGLIGILGFVPLPNYFRAEGIVKAENFSRIYAATSGTLVELLTPSGEMVQKGDPLLKFSNHELTLELASVDAEILQIQARIRQSLVEDPLQNLSLKPYLKALENRRAILLEDLEALVVHSPCHGRWLAPDSPLFRGALQPRGSEIGVVQGEDKFYLSAIIHQSDASRIFTPELLGSAEVRVRGQEGLILETASLQAIPSNQESLPSAALGIIGGGSTTVSIAGSREKRSMAGGDLVREQPGKKVSEAVFELRAPFVHEAVSDIRLIHGQRAVLRMQLPPEPLFSQWYLALRQIFQQTYRI